MIKEETLYTLIQFVKDLKDLKDTDKKYILLLIDGLDATFDTKQGDLIVKPLKVATFKGEGLA